MFEGRRVSGFFGQDLGEGGLAERRGAEKREGEGICTAESGWPQRVSGFLGQDCRIDGIWVMGRLAERRGAEKREGEGICTAEGGWP